MTTVTRTITIDKSNAAEYLVKESTSKSSVTIPSGNAAVKMAGSSNPGSAYVKLTQAALNELFPNSTAKPTTLAVAYTGYGEHDNTSSRLNFEVDGATLVDSKGIEDKDTLYNLDAKYVDMSPSSSMRFYMLGRRQLFGTNTIYLSVAILAATFNSYSFGASADDNTSTSLSSSSGFDGDKITFKATPKSGCVFDGWYNGTTRVSTSQSYTVTVNGADVFLTAKSVKKSGLITVRYGDDVIETALTQEEEIDAWYDGMYIIYELPKYDWAVIKCAGKVMSDDIRIDIGMSDVDGSGTFSKHTMYIRCNGKFMEHDLKIIILDGD